MNEAEEGTLKDDSKQLESEQQSPSVDAVVMPIEDVKGPVLSDAPDVEKPADCTSKEAQQEEPQPDGILVEGQKSEESVMIETRSVSKDKEQDDGGNKSEHEEPIISEVDELEIVSIEVIVDELMYTSLVLLLLY